MTAIACSGRHCDPAVAHCALPPRWRTQGTDDECELTDDCLLGQLSMGGADLHVVAIRVERPDGVLRATDPQWQTDLESLQQLCGDDGLTTTTIPGHEGDYVIGAYPHAE